MAKAGMRRPDSKDSQAPGGGHKTRQPKNKQPPVPEIKGKKHNQGSGGH